VLHCLQTSTTRITCRNLRTCVARDTQITANQL